MSSYGHGISGSTETIVYFEDMDDAERVREDLMRSGVPAAAMNVESKETGTGFLEAIKRFFSGEERDYSGGAILSIDRQYVDQNCLLTIRNYGGSVADMPQQDAAEADVERRMPLREEQLSIDKRPVESGEAVVRKDVVTETRHVDVPVQHEEVYVEHRPSSGVEAAEGEIKEGDEIHIPVTKEELDVEKRLVKTGDVVVGKRSVQESESVDETIRKEKARVDTSGDVRTRQS